MTVSRSRTEAQRAIPLLPLRDVVVFPNMVIPLFVGREKSIRSLDAAMDGDKQILLVAQKSPDIDDPIASDLYELGTLANVLQLLKLPDGTIKVLVEGVSRVQLSGVETLGDVLHGRMLVVESQTARDSREVDAAAKSLLSLFETFIKLNRKVPPELMNTLAGIDEPSRLADTVAAHLGVRLQDKQQVLETLDVYERLERLIGLVNAEIDLQQIEKRIRGRVKTQMEKSQREYYLNEQMKAIQKELGDLDEAPNELDELARKIGSAGMPKAVTAKARNELNKLKQMSPMSAEATVVRNYLDWLLGAPWKKRTKIRKDLPAAELVLDADHYGLEKVKERILEYLAVQQRVKKMKGPILCLVGPPGVGKTSLGQSIARATNRKFIRMALGGVRDEAEIRGHRRTYIGSMPGRVIQNLSKAGVRNPLVMLDEIDKMSTDFRGDPSSALLEVLDPEQNHTFNDHYLEVDFDLSDVMFIATANSLNIPSALLDRMEVIRIPGYTEEEKVGIAERYLLATSLLAAGRPVRRGRRRESRLSNPGDGSIQDGVDQTLVDIPQHDLATAHGGVVDWLRRRRLGKSDDDLGEHFDLVGSASLLDVFRQVLVRDDEFTLLVEVGHRLLVRGRTRFDHLLLLRFRTRLHGQILWEQWELARTARASGC